MKTNSTSTWSINKLAKYILERITLHPGENRKNAFKVAKRNLKEVGRLYKRGKDAAI